MPEEEFDSIDHIKGNITKRKKAERKRKRKRVFSILLRIAFVAFVITGLVLFDRSEYSRVRTIRVEGNSVYTDTEIENILGINEGDRLIMNLPFLLNGKAKKIGGLDSIDASLYYSQGIVNVHVNEYKAVGYIQSETVSILFEDGTTKPLENEALSSIKGLPVFIGYAPDALTKELLGVFGQLDQELLLTISEVHWAPTEFDQTYMKLVMNNNYYVFTSSETLPVLRSYASIISKADPGSRCIIMSEYGPSENANLATVKPCE